MMIYLYMRMHVKDYARWKETFDTHLAARQAGGATGQIFVMRNVDDLNEVTVLLSWRDLNTAQLFAKSMSFHDFIKNSSTIDDYELRFLETDERGFIRLEPFLS